MVSAWTAEIRSSEVVVYKPDRKPAAAKRGDFSDPGERHGVDLDAADEWLEQQGYVVGRPVWNESGRFYRAVVTPESAFQARRKAPVYSDASMDEWYRTPEGQRHQAWRAKRGKR